MPHAPRLHLAAALLLTSRSSPRPDSTPPRSTSTATTPTRRPLLALAVHPARRRSDGTRERPRLRPRFKPFLKQNLTAPQSFWGKDKPLSESPSTSSRPPRTQSSATTTAISPPTAASSTSAPIAASSGSTSACPSLSSSSPPSTGSPTTARPTTRTPPTPCGSSAINPSTPPTSPAALVRSITRWTAAAVLRLHRSPEHHPRPPRRS